MLSGMVKLSQRVLRYGFYAFLQNETESEVKQMANYGRSEKYELTKNRILHTAAVLFLTNGYEATSLKAIAKAAETNTGALNRSVGSKDEILAFLVRFVLEEQFSKATEFVKGKTEDKILFYCAETVLQLYITESNENIRELYSVAYSHPTTTKIIQNIITEKLEYIFKEHLPHLESKDFFEKEIASGGIMRGFMTVPCDRYFTMERKVAAFLETTLLVYEVPKEKIKQAIEFVSQFDYKKIAGDLVDSMLEKIQNEQ